MNAYIKMMVVDKWGGVSCSEEETAMPLLGDMERAVDKLDQKTRTIVSLHGSDGSYLTIGGGSGRYVVYASMADDQLWNLIDEGKRNQGGVVLLNAGGQEGDFRMEQVVGKSQVLQAARVFFKSCKLDSSLLWEKQI